MSVSFRHYRIFVLLLILAIVAWDQWLDKIELRAWDRPLRVVVYPINADGSKNAQLYMKSLRERQFDRIETVVQQQAQYYGLSLDQPIDLLLAPEVRSLPPQPPRGGNILDIMWWNFKVRRWANKVDQYSGAKGDIRAFVQYHDFQNNDYLSHSVGVEKGRLAIVNLFATRAQSAENDMILLHEILHTLGAKDKYDPASNQPLFPIGYADPEQQPLHPQKRAEVMAGRIPINEYQFEPLRSLNQLIIGPATALEIGWLKE